MKYITSIEEGDRLFNIEIDFDELLLEAKNTIESWDDNYPYVKMNEDIDTPVTKEEFNQEMDQMINDINALRDIETIRSLVDKAGRKKDGYFAKGRVVYYKQYGTTAHYWEDSYGWYHTCIRLKTTGPNIAKIIMSREIEHY